VSSDFLGHVQQKSLVAGFHFRKYPHRRLSPRLLWRYDLQIREFLPIYFPNPVRNTRWNPYEVALPNLSLLTARNASPAKFVSFRLSRLQ
jgi:hypothetical protein